MRKYLDIVRHVLENGERKQNRTGVDAITVAGCMFDHDMQEGFPLLTTKHVPFKSVKVELEFFIGGYTDKRWLQERGCTIWDQWASPRKVPYGTDEKTQAAMRSEPDLGPIYGWSWRRFGAEYPAGMEDPTCGVDQLARLVQTLKHNPGDRRMIVSAWNPAQLAEMALPPCHYAFQVTVINGKLNLLWNQRSVDTMLGLPFNIASYALLLHLLAKGAGLAEGRLIGFLADTHIYVNHVEGAEEQLGRKMHSLPKVVTAPPAGQNDLLAPFDLFAWQHADTLLNDYVHEAKIHFEIAV